ncbi:MAG: hypothetical protein ACLSF2_09435 [Butyricicoccus sp.]
MNVGSPLFIWIFKRESLCRQLTSGRSPRTGWWTGIRHRLPVILTNPAKIAVLLKRLPLHQRNQRFRRAQGNSRKTSTVTAGTTNRRTAETTYSLALANRSQAYFELVKTENIIARANEPQCSNRARH